MGFATDLFTLTGSKKGQGAYEADTAAALEAQQEYLNELSGLDAEADSSVDRDSMVRAAQVEAIRQLQEIGSSGGMDQQSRSAIAEATQQAAAQENAQRQAIMSQAAQRGTIGGGQELASKLMAQQGAANRASAASGSAVSDARSRALAALSQSGNQAAQTSAIDLAYQKAQDSANQFNAAQRADVARMRSSPYTNIAATLSDRGKERAKQSTAQGAGTGAVLEDAFKIGSAIAGYAKGGLVRPAVGDRMRRFLANAKVVPGSAPHPGDDERNDKVPIMASPGEIVLPRSVAQAPDAPEKAMREVARIRAESALRRR